MYVVDFRGVASASNAITLQRSGSDTVNGATSAVAVNAQYGWSVWMSDGVSRWTFQQGGAGGGTVTNVSINAGSNINTSGTCSIVTSGTCTVGVTSTPTFSSLTTNGAAGSNVTIDASNQTMAVNTGSNAPLALGVNSGMIFIFDGTSGGEAIVLLGGGTTSVVATTTERSLSLRRRRRPARPASRTTARRRTASITTLE